VPFHHSFLAIGLLGLTNAYAQGPIQATCTQSSGDKQLMQVSPSSIEVRSGSSHRSMDLADIRSIDMTGPVNRGSRLAWATLRTSKGEQRNVGIMLPTADGTLVLDGVNAQGRPDTIDVLDCKRIEFRTGS
jgi:hypothetical protein